MKGPIHKVGRGRDGYVNRKRVSLVWVGSKGIPGAVVVEESRIGEIVNRIGGLVLQNGITGIFVLGWVKLIQISWVLVFVQFCQDNRKSNGENQDSDNQESQDAQDNNSSPGVWSREESPKNSFFLSILVVFQLFRLTARELTSRERLNGCCCRGLLVLEAIGCEEVQHLERMPRYPLVISESQFR